MKTLHSVIKTALGSARKSIRIKGSFRSAGFGTATPVQIIDGGSAPELRGQPYLKTNFKIGNFTKTLYTPSTLHVAVGRDWVDARLTVPSGETGPFAIARI